MEFGGTPGVWNSRGVEGAAPYRGVTIPGGEGQKRIAESPVRIDTGGTPAGPRPRPTER